MTLANERYVEELYYRAVDLINEGEFAEAKEALIEVLVEDPIYALAHNQLGWIYMYQLNNLVKAMEHFELAIKYGEGFAVPHSNYAYLLLQLNDFSGLERFVDEAINEPGVDLAYLLAMKAIAFEVNRKYRVALKLIEESRRYALNQDYINNLNGDKERIRLKMSRLERVLSVLF